jgi:tetratricopeptide (TPR) repeat protein
MRNDLLKGEAFYGIGKNLRIMGRYDESMKCYKKALQYLWRASKRHPFAETLEIELYQ